MRSLVAVAVAVVGTLVLGACAGGNIVAWDLRAIAARTCCNEPTAEHTSGWYVRRYQRGVGPDIDAIFYCDGLGKCRQAKSAVPFRAGALIAGPAVGPHAWLVATLTDGSPESVFLCDATATPPICGKQEEVSPTGGPALPPPPDKGAGFRE
jgi:hypothetical protein